MILYLLAFASRTQSIVIVKKLRYIVSRPVITNSNQHNNPLSIKPGNFCNRSSLGAQGSSSKELQADELNPTTNPPPQSATTVASVLLKVTDCDGTAVSIQHPLMEIESPSTSPQHSIPAKGNKSALKMCPNEAEFVWNTLFIAIKRDRVCTLRYSAPFHKYKSVWVLERVSRLSGHKGWVDSCAIK